MCVFMCILYEWPSVHLCISVIKSLVIEILSRTEILKSEFHRFLRAFAGASAYFLSSLFILCILNQQEYQKTRSFDEIHHPCGLASRQAQKQTHRTGDLDEAEFCQGLERGPGTGQEAEAGMKYQKTRSGRPALVLAAWCISAPGDLELLR